MTKLESRYPRGLLGKPFGKGFVAGLLLAVFLIGGTAWAQTYNTFGFGLQSCGSWTAAAKKEPGVGIDVMRFAYTGWISGFLTAYGWWVEDGSGPVSNLSNIEGPLAWIDKYCQENPLKAVDAAAAQLIHAIKAN